MSAGVETSGLDVQALLEGMPCAFASFDASGRVRHANRLASLLLVAPGEPVVGQPLELLLAEPGAAVLRTRLKQALMLGRPTEFEAEHGTLQLWLRVRALPLQGGLNVYLEDVTQRKRAEEALRATNALLTSLFESSRDAVFTKDLRGRYTRINDAGAAALGRRVVDILGKEDGELWPAPLAEAIVAKDREALAHGVVLHCEEVDPAGPLPRVWESTRGVLRDAQGTPIGLFGISRDVTELRRLEALVQARARR